MPRCFHLPPRIDTTGEVHNLKHRLSCRRLLGPPAPKFGGAKTGNPPELGGLKPFGHTRKGGLRGVCKFAKYFASGIRIGGLGGPATGIVFSRHPLKSKNLAPQNLTQGTRFHRRTLAASLIGGIAAIAPLTALAITPETITPETITPETITSPTITPPTITLDEIPPSLVIPSPDPLPLAQSFGGQSGDRFRSQGIQQANQGNYAAAIALLEQAVTAYRTSGNTLGEALSLKDLGTVHRLAEQPTPARDRLEQALAIIQTLNDPSLEAETLNLLGVVANDIGDYNAALSYFEQALALNRRLNSPLQTAQALANLGATHQSLGNYEPGIAALQEAISIFQRLGDQALEAQSLAQLGLLYTRMGRYPQALTELQVALDKRRRIGDRVGEAVTLNLFCLVYERLGQHERALDHCQRSLAILETQGNRSNLAYTLNNLGAVQESRQQYAAAQVAYERALVLQQDTGDRSGEAITLNNLGSLFYNQQQDDQALPYYNAALELFQATNSRFGEVRALNNIGLIYARQDRVDDAIAVYNQALAIVQTLEDPPAEARLRRNLALVSAQQNRLDDAESQLRRSLVLLDQVRAAELSDAEKISLFETQQDIYRTLEQVLILTDRPTDALLATEQGRTRVFANLIAANLSDQAAAMVNLPPPDLADIRRIAQTQNATLVEYALSDRDLGEAALHIWVVQPDGAVHFRTVSLQDLSAFETTRTTDPLLDTLVEDVRLTIGGRGIGVVASANATSPADPAGDPGVYHQLYQRLIDPIAEFLPTDPEDQVIFIPQGSLFFVPFAALQDASGQALIERHTISTVPSIQVLGLTQQLSQGSTGAIANLAPADFLVVGNPTMPQIWSPETNALAPLPPLPGAQQEAEAIAALFDLSALIGSQATETQVKQQATRAQVIHLATHGLLEYGEVESSGVRDLPGAIALTPGNGNDGLLTAAEILQLDLQADLVVLSACDTGLGRITGDGVVGLSRALVAAGVPSVVVSLWSVPDAPTAELMTVFYQQLSQGQDKAQALRQAMLTVRDRYPHPRNWAAFTLMGETN